MEKLYFIRCNSCIDHIAVTWCLSIYNMHNLWDWMEMTYKCVPQHFLRHILLIPLWQMNFLNDCAEVIRKRNMCILVFYVISDVEHRNRTAALTLMQCVRVEGKHLLYIYCKEQSYFWFLLRMRFLLIRVSFLFLFDFVWTHFQFIISVCGPVLIDFTYFFYRCILTFL